MVSQKYKYMLQMNYYWTDGDNTCVHVQFS